MKGITCYYKRLRITYMLTAFCVSALAVLFVPSFGRFERTGDNMFDIYLNQNLVGVTSDPAHLEELVQKARENLVQDADAMIFMNTDLTWEGKEVIVGTIDSDRKLEKRMEEILAQSQCKTLKHAYTVKINEYTVNLASSSDVVKLLNKALQRYDASGSYSVDLVVDPDRELNVLTTSIAKTDEKKNGGENFRNEAGLSACVSDVFSDAGSMRTESFETIGYGLTGIAFADEVEVVEAYLKEEEITSLEAAIEEVTKEQETEQIYEVQAGDTLSQIAQTHGLTVDGLVAINPGLEDAGSMIRTGDELIITVPEPELSVIHQEMVYTEDSYDADVIYVDVDDWYTTKQEVTQQPSAGHRKAASLVTYKNDEKIDQEIVLQEVDYEAVPKIVRRGTKVPPTYIKPISGGRLTSSYGRRSAPVKGASTNHKGTDWAVPVGTAVMASCGGTVTKAGWGSGYGYCVYIQHEDGRMTIYGHLSKVLVSAGQKVKQGQKIALSGNTGRSSGPHLHFEMRINGSPVNALNYLN